MKKYGNWVKFGDLSKKDKIFRIVNIIFSLSMFFATLGMLIYYLKTGDKNNRFWSCIMMLVLYILPFLFELIFRRRIKNLITFCYLFYALIAGFIGNVFNLYHNPKTEWIDIIIHTLAGYTFSLVGIFILTRLENYSSLKIWTVVLFCFATTLAVELIWELCEWTCDSLLGQIAQGEKIEGYGAPLVTDTNLDMLCNFCGGLIFAIQFIIGKTTKHSLGIKFIEKEISPDKQDNPDKLESTLDETQETDNKANDNTKTDDKL